MKPLKEIGFRVTPNENSVTQHEPYTTFTDDERRELVRRVWEKAQELRIKDGQGWFNLDDVEEFLKSEGL